MTETIEIVDACIASFAAAEELPRRWAVSQAWSARWRRQEVWEALRKLSLDYSSIPVGDAGALRVAARLPPRLRRLSLGFADSGVSARGARGLLEGLPATSLTALELSFAGCPGMKDALLETLASRLPPQLERLGLDLSDCAGIGDAGLAVLGRALLATSISSFGVSLARCGVGTEGLADLARQLLPRGWLRDLRLDLSSCTRVTDTALASLSVELARIPPDAWLEELNLSFSRCEIGDAGVAALGLALSSQGSASSSSLRRLNLNFARCEVGFVGLECFADKLPRNLEVFEMNLTHCGMSLGDMGVSPLARRLPLGLVELALFLGNCGVGDKGAAEIGAKLPKLRHLRRLTLELEGHGELGEPGIDAIMEGLPEELDRLQLNFQGNRLGPHRRSILAALLRQRNEDICRRSRLLVCPGSSGCSSRATTIEAHTGLAAGSCGGAARGRASGVSGAGLVADGGTGVLLAPPRRASASGTKQPDCCVTFRV